MEEQSVHVGVDDWHQNQADGAGKSRKGDEHVEDAECGANKEVITSGEEGMNLMDTGYVQVGVAGDSLSDPLSTDAVKEVGVLTVDAAYAGNAAALDSNGSEASAGQLKPAMSEEPVMEPPPAEGAPVPRYPEGEPSVADSAMGAPVEVPVDDAPVDADAPVDNPAGSVAMPADPPAEVPVEEVSSESSLVEPSASPVQEECPAATLGETILEASLGGVPAENSVEGVPAEPPFVKAAAVYPREEGSGEMLAETISEKVPAEASSAEMAGQAAIEETSAEATLEEVPTENVIEVVPAEAPLEEPPSMVMPEEDSDTTVVGTMSEEVITEASLGDVVMQAALEVAAAKATLEEVLVEAVTAEAELKEVPADATPDEVLAGAILEAESVVAVLENARFDHFSEEAPSTVPLEGSPAETLSKEALPEVLMEKAVPAEPSPDEAAGNACAQEATIDAHPEEATADIHPEEAAAEEAAPMAHSQVAHGLEETSVEDTPESFCETIPGPAVGVTADGVDSGAAAIIEVPAEAGMEGPGKAASEGASDKATEMSVDAVETTIHADLLPAAFSEAIGDTFADAIVDAVAEALVDAVDIVINPFVDAVADSPADAVDDSPTDAIAKPTDAIAKPCEKAVDEAPLDGASNPLMNASAVSPAGSVGRVLVEGTPGEAAVDALGRDAVDASPLEIPLESAKRSSGEDSEAGIDGALGEVFVDGIAKSTEVSIEETSLISDKKTVDGFSVGVVPVCNNMSDRVVLSDADAALSSVLPPLEMNTQGLTGQAGDVSSSCSDMAVDAKQEDVGGLVDAVADKIEKVGIELLVNPEVVVTLVKAEVDRSCAAGFAGKEAAQVTEDELVNSGTVSVRALGDDIVSAVGNKDVVDSFVDDTSNKLHDLKLPMDSMLERIPAVGTDAKDKLQETYTPLLWSSFPNGGTPRTEKQIEVEEAVPVEGHDAVGTYEGEKIVQSEDPELAGYSPDKSVETESLPEKGSKDTTGSDAVASFTNGLDMAAGVASASALAGAGVAALSGLFDDVANFENSLPIATSVVQDVQSALPSVPATFLAGRMGASVVPQTVDPIVEECIDKRVMGEAVVVGSCSIDEKSQVVEDVVATASDGSIVDKALKLVQAQGPVVEEILLRDGKCEEVRQIVDGAKRTLETVLGDDNSGKTGTKEDTGLVLVAAMEKMAEDAGQGVSAPAAVVGGVKGAIYSVAADMGIAPVQGTSGVDALQTNLAGSVPASLSSLLERRTGILGGSGFPLVGVTSQATDVADAPAVNLQAQEKSGAGGTDLLSPEASGHCVMGSITRGMAVRDVSTVPGGLEEGKRLLADRVGQLRATLGTEGASSMSMMAVAKNACELVKSEGILATVPGSGRSGEAASQEESKLVEGHEVKSPVQDAVVTATAVRNEKGNSSSPAVDPRSPLVQGITGVVDLSANLRGLNPASHVSDLERRTRDLVDGVETLGVALRGSVSLKDVAEAAVANVSQAEEKRSADAQDLVVLEAMGEGGLPSSTRDLDAGPIPSGLREGKKKLVDGLDELGATIGTSSIFPVTRNMAMEVSTRGLHVNGTALPGVAVDASPVNGEERVPPANVFLRLIECCSQPFQLFVKQNSPSQRRFPVQEDRAQVLPEVAKGISGSSQVLPGIAGARVPSVAKKLGNASSSVMAQSATLVGNKFGSATGISLQRGLDNLREEVRSHLAALPSGQGISSLGSGLAPDSTCIPGPMVGKVISQQQSAAVKTM